MSDQLDLGVAQKFAENLVKTAGHLLLDYAGKIEIVEHKDRQDIATNADLASEKLIIDAIAKEYPDHNILSEERGKIDNKSAYTWLIDPLDSTKEYLRGIPLYNVSLLLERDGEGILSVIFAPTSGHLYSAVLGQGAFLNGKKIKISAQEELVNSFIYTYLPVFNGNDEEFEMAWKKLSTLSRSVYRLRSLQDLNLACSWLAMGGCEAFVLISNPPEPWDIKPGLFLARQAGARISDLLGKPVTEDFGSGIIVSNVKIHQSLLEVLNGS